MGRSDNEGALMRSDNLDQGELWTVAFKVYRGYQRLCAACSPCCASCAEHGLIRDKAN